MGKSEPMSTLRIDGRIVLLLAFIFATVTLHFFVQHSDQTTFNKDAQGSEDLSYGLVMDAGSTGTRMFLYQWSSHSDKQLIDIRPTLDHNHQPVVRKISPGLSSFANHSQDAAEYIRPLLDYAVEFVPEAKRSHTPVFIFSTAGMRLVPEQQKQAILADLHTKLPRMTTLQILKENIRVIEGKWEGIYSWISANYILGRFNTPDVLNSAGQPITRKNTVGMMDMGGASVQIAFELPSTSSFHSEHVEEINLGCHDESPLFKYNLFVTTFLGYGVNEGMKRYEQELYETHGKVNGSLVLDACMPVNLQQVAINDDGSRFLRKGAGDWDECVMQLATLIDPGPKPTCLPECFFGSVAAPELDLSEMEFFGFSEFWYSVNDVLSLGGPYNFSVVEEKSRQFCNQRWNAIQAQSRRHLYPSADEDRLRSQCFKSAWITAALHRGFDISPIKNKYESVMKLGGQEVQWTLGAMLYHLRYVPLRDAHTKYISSGSALVSWLSFPELETIFVLACIGTALYLLASSSSNQRRSPIVRGIPDGKTMKRGPCMWGTTQQDVYSPRYIVKSPSSIS